MQVIAYEASKQNCCFFSSSTTDSSWLLQVVLAANDMPSINDITYEELVQVISKVRHPSSTKNWCVENWFFLESKQNWMVSKLLSQHVAYVCSSTTCSHPIQSPFSVWPIQVGWIAVWFWATWSWLCCWVFIWMFINNLWWMDWSDADPDRLMAFTGQNYLSRWEGNILWCRFTAAYGCQLWEWLASEWWVLFGNSNVGSELHYHWVVISDWLRHPLCQVCQVQTINKQWFLASGDRLEPYFTRACICCRGCWFGYAGRHGKITTSFNGPQFCQAW